MSEEIKTIPLRHATNEDYTKIIADLSTANVSKEMEIIRLNNIIKEVREYIKKRKEDNKSCSVCSVITDELLEILDKENK